jgi:hypothetical protein
MLLAKAATAGSAKPNTKPKLHISNRLIIVIVLTRDYRG